MFLRFSPSICFVHIMDSLRRRYNNRQMLRQKTQDAMNDVNVGHPDRCVLSDSKHPCILQCGRHSPACEDHRSRQGQLWNRQHRAPANSRSCVFGHILQLCLNIRYRSNTHTLSADCTQQTTELNEGTRSSRSVFHTGFPIMCC